MTLASIANKGTFPVSMMTSIYPMVLRYSFYKIVQAELQIRFFYESVTSHPSKENEKGRSADLFKLVFTFFGVLFGLSFLFHGRKHQINL